MGFVKRVAVPSILAGLLSGMIFIAGCAALKAVGAGAVEGAKMAGSDAIHERVQGDNRIPDDLKPVAEGVADAVKAAIPPAPPTPAEQMPLFMLSQALVYGILTSLKERMRSKGMFGLK